MLDEKRHWFYGLESITAKIFCRLPFLPNHYTIFSILSAVAGAFFMIRSFYFPALAFFAISALMDFVDGAVARAKNLSKKSGAYFDTIADRYVETIFLFSLLFVPLPDFYIPLGVWIFLALFGSMMTTYAKAAAKEKGLSDAELKGGLMSRGERLVLIFMIILLIGINQIRAAAAIIILLAGLSNFTALQRICKAVK